MKKLQLKYFFFKTVNINGKIRLRPLPGQVENSGRPILETLNVHIDERMRKDYPLGTIFGSDHIEFRTIHSTEFYSTGIIYPLGIKENEYLSEEHKPPQDMVEALKRKLLPKDVLTEKTEPPQETSSTTETPVNSLLHRIKSDANLAVPTIEKDGFFIEEKKWYLLMRNILNKKNTIMTGHSGTGKTELVMLACKKLGIDCHVYDMGSMYDPVSGLLGVHRLQKGGESVFDYAKFTQDIQKPGVILLDELSRAPVTTNNILFPCLDSRRMLPVEMAGGNDLRSISIHPDCIFIATANIGAEYTGTMMMDKALTGRFFPLEMDYVPYEHEVNLLMNRCGIDKDKANNIAYVAQVIRSLYSKQEISASVSTRETIAAAELVADGWETLEAMELMFLPLFEGTKTEGERSIVAKIFITR